MAEASEPTPPQLEETALAELFRVLRPLERLEELMRQFYEQCAEQFRSDAEASALFARLAFEERSHAAEVQFLRRVVGRSKEPMAQVKLDLSQLEREQERLEAVLSALTGMQLLEVVEIALVFEQGAGELHSRSAIGAASPGLSNLLKHLGRADHNHRARLAEFLACRRGGIVGDAP